MRLGRTMRKVLFSAVLLLLSTSALAQSSEEPFQQVSDHCYFLHIEESGENIAVVVTDQGTLLFDPPPEPDLSILFESLKTVTGGPVRWMIRTGFPYFQTAGVEYFSQLGAVLLTGSGQSVPSVPEPGPSTLPFQTQDPGFSQGDYNDPDNATIAFSGQTGSKPAFFDTPELESSSVPQFIFKKDLYLYPDDLEIRIVELEQEAWTKADVFAYVPDEKVLFVGRLFEAFYYPDIDALAGGSALKWIDGLEQIINSVPLLISAIPPEKPDEEGENEDGAETDKQEVVEGEDVLVEEEEEVTLEELIAVVSSRGDVSNLQIMKEMLEASKRLRNGLSRAVKAGRSCERYLNSSSTNPYRIYGNFSFFTTQLCNELTMENNMENKTEKTEE